MSSSQTDLSFQSEIGRAVSAREFLRLWLHRARSKNPKCSFESLAIRAGFSSRSYVRQVLLGEKPLTQQAFPRFLRMLNLDKNQEKLLRLLLALEDPNFNIEAKSRVTLSKEIEAVREKIQSRKALQVRPKPLKSMLLKQTASIYPHLGRGLGRTPPDISSVTGLPLVDCEWVLKNLVREGYARQEGDHFFATERLLQVQVPPETDLVKNHLLAGLHIFQEELRQNARLPEDRLYLRAQYTVSSKRMLEFKAQLRQLLVEFAENSEDDQGDRVCHLICGFF